jgi:Tfp pilus assembly protein PilO
VSVSSLTSSKRTLVVVISAAVALWAVAMWFLFVSPKRAEATRLEADLVAAEAELMQARASAGQPGGLPQTRVSDLFRLAKAMPSSGDQASLLLELDVLARRTNVALASVTLQEPAPLPSGTTAIPVAVTVSGSYREITRFLRQMRRLVSLSGGNPRAVGRLLTVQSVELTESKEDGFPRLDAAILLNAHVYDGPMAPATPETPPAEPGDELEDGTSAAAGATS